MTGAQDIPQWATDKAKAIRDSAYARGVGTITEAYARWFAENTEPPVDPLLIEARSIAGKIGMERGYHPYWAEETAKGEHDNNEYVIGALAGLRRGIEIASDPNHGR